MISPFLVLDAKKVRNTVLSVNSFSEISEMGSYRFDYEKVVQKINPKQGKVGEPLVFLWEGTWED